MLAEVSPVVMIVALGAAALAAMHFLQRAMGAGGAPRSPAEPRGSAAETDVRRRAPLPFARALLFWLILAPAFGFVLVWTAAVRDLGAPALTALALFVAPLLVVWLAFLSKGGIEP